MSLGVFLKGTFAENPVGNQLLLSPLCFYYSSECYCDSSYHTWPIAMESVVYISGCPTRHLGSSRLDSLCQFSVLFLNKARLS